MTADTRNTMTDQPQRSIVARTIGEQAVLDWWRPRTKGAVALCDRHPES